MINTNGWVNEREFGDLSAAYHLKQDAADAAEDQLVFQLADGAFDAGFEAGVEAQKHGLGEAA